MEKRILIVCVNYNSYPELRNYLASIEASVAACSLPCQVDVWVADNSSEKEIVDTTLYKQISVQVKPLDNLGYLGGAAAIINNLPNLLEYDFVIISNVDVILKHSFFDCLSYYVENGLERDVAWIAPRIYSLSERRDRNPKVRYRYSQKKLKTLLLMYRFPVLHYLYTEFIYSHRKKASDDSLRQDIYAGHGSFMIFTRSFVSAMDKISYPVFLFGEELYFAEIIRNKGLKVKYVPDIVVDDIDHVSTSKMKSRFYYNCNREALKYILKEFYEQS